MEEAMTKHKWFSMLALIGLLASIAPMGGTVASAEDSRYFPETGHTVKGLFLAYWNTHGGLAQQGYPISEEIQEQSDTDGKVYTMQYFERAVFEAHPENQPPYNVLLSLLGVFYYNEKYGGNAPNQHTSTDNPRKFSETGKTIGGAFRRYWETHGGLPQQGYPISDEFQEVSQTNGKTYTVQYFQRAVFELHPEYAGTPSEVLLSLLGVFYYDKKHSGTPQPTAPPPAASPTTQSVATPPTATQPPTAPSPTATPGPVGATGQILFFNTGTALGQPALIDTQGSIFYQPSFQVTTPGPNWTHVVSIGNGYLLFYKIAQGGRIGKLDPDGTYHDIKVGIPYSAGWDQIASYGSSKLAFFNPTSKQLVTEVIAADGTPVDLKTITLPTTWQKMVATSSGMLLFYADLNTGGTTVGAVLTGRVDAQGNVTQLQSNSTLPPGWTHIIPTHNDYLFFYSSASGGAFYASVSGDGTFAQHPSHTFGAGWTNFADTSNGVFLVYRADNGEALTRLSDYYTTYRELKAYQGNNALATGWTHIIPIR
jgi:hypothetical protein